MSLLLSNKVELSDLSVGNDTDDGTVLYDTSKLLVNWFAFLSIFLDVLGECLVC
jgi:hypothetical protein